MRVFLGITGASGAPYAKRLVESLAAGSDVMRFSVLNTRTVSPDVEAFAKQYGLKLAPSYEAVAAWLDTVAKDKAIADVWTGTIQRTEVEGVVIVNWQATAILADGAKSGRLDTIVKGKQ